MYEIRGVLAYEAGMIPWRHTAQELHSADPGDSVARMVRCLFDEMAKHLSKAKLAGPKAISISFGVSDRGRSTPEAGEGEMPATTTKRRKPKPSTEGVVEGKLPVAENVPEVHQQNEGRWDCGKGTD